MLVHQLGALLRLAPLRHIMNMHLEAPLLLLLLVLLLVLLLLVYIHFRLLVNILLHLRRWRGLEEWLRGHRGRGLLGVHSEDFGFDFLKRHEFLWLGRGRSNGVGFRGRCRGDSRTRPPERHVGTQGGDMSGGEVAGRLVLLLLVGGSRGGVHDGWFARRAVEDFVFFIHGSCDFGGNAVEIKVFACRLQFTGKLDLRVGNVGTGFYAPILVSPPPNVSSLKTSSFSSRASPRPS